MRRVLQFRRTDGTLPWLGLAVVLVATGWSASQGAVGWILFGGILAVILLAPVVAYRSLGAMPPWPATALAAIPFAIAVVAPDATLVRVATYAAVAAAALVVVAELDAFTPVRMNRGFAVALVVMATVTTAGVWELGKWLFDLAAGTTLVESNDAVMWRLIAAAGAGVVAGVVFDRYLRQSLREEFVPGEFEPEDAEEQVDAVGGAVSDALATAGLSRGRQRRIVRLLQVLLASLVVVGIVTLNLSVAVNAAVGLGATFLPAVFERDLDLEMDVGLTLWIAVAVAIHAMGSFAFYQTVWGWHNLAHATTGTLVAAIGYTAVRALEEHTRAVSFPPKFTFVVVVLFVFSVGIFWEILEFALDGIAAALGREGLLLGQHGLTDTMSDLLANTVGALFVAGVATIYRLR